MRVLSVLGSFVGMLIGIIGIFVTGYVLGLLRKNDVDIRITTKKVKGGKDVRLG